jgi:LysM repeat protein
MGVPKNFHRQTNLPKMVEALNDLTFYDFEYKVVLTEEYDKKLKESGGIAPKIETLSVTISEDQKMNIQNGFYIVQKGETLYGISKNTGVSVEDLQKFNNLVGNEVKVSQKLILKL